jgi:GT2 family glycosyltransferase
MPLVSVIVVNWNGERLLQPCLAALQRQTYADREIILVDNGSTDSSVSLVRRKFPEVKIVELPENRGFAGGNNAGLAASRGRVIALMNNDAQADEKWLDHMMQALLSDPRVGMCASKLLFDGSGRIQSAGDGLTTAGAGYSRGLGRAEAFFPVPDFVFGACAASALYRREMIEEIGFLDEEFFFNDEDTDLNCRAQLAGWKCLYVPDGVVHHKGSATIGRLSEQHVYYHSRNLEFVWVKNMPGALMLRYAHHKVLQEIGSFCYLCLRHGKWKPFFKGKSDALRKLPLMLRRRREVQLKRRASTQHVKHLLTPLYSKEVLRQKVNQFFRG